jgi:quinolinate synthase
MIAYCKNSFATAFVIVTEEGMLHRLRREIPNKVFIPGPTDHCACAECRYMKLNTLEKLYHSLRDLTPEITLDEPLRKLAEGSVRRMLELSK